MSLDNVLAVAGAAKGEIWVLAVGLTVAVGFMALLSAYIAKLLARYHWITWIGLAIVLYVARGDDLDRHASGRLPVRQQGGLRRRRVANAEHAAVMTTEPRHSTACKSLTRVRTLTNAANAGMLLSAIPPRQTFPMTARLRILFPLLLLCSGASAETPEQWVTLLSRVHGGFGSFLPVGIRIGEDAMKRLDAKPRELSVVFYQGEGVPCPCPADGVMLAVWRQSGPGHAPGRARRKSPPRHLRRRDRSGRAKAATV